MRCKTLRLFYGNVVYLWYLNKTIINTHLFEIIKLLNLCNLFLEKGQIIYQLEDSKGIVKKKDNSGIDI